ncbi:MAG: hypothetical protein ACUVQ3_03205 [bacterium]
MIFVVIFTGLLNPYISANVLATDDYTNDYLNNLYQFEMENRFSNKNLGWAGYLDYFYNRNYPFSNPYFIKSGIPITLKAWGAGLQLKYLAMENIEFGIGIGYYTGNVSYPLPEDSGRVVKKIDTRSSMGLCLGINMTQNFSRITCGLRFYTNLIGFGAKEHPPWYEYYQRSVDYISLNTVGLGLIIGLSRRKEQ